MNMRLGSSSYLTDNFGRPTHYYDQLPFGESMVEHNQSQYYGNQYKFNGKELDAATGMYYYGARYYDPRLSIFISVDPLAEQTMEPYQYVSNNPIMLIDPDGMSPISVFAKMAAKSGLKQTAKSTVKSVITNRLKAYSSKGWAKQLMGDALDAIDMAMGQAWWEYAIEVIPIAGDAYGGYKLTDQGVTVWKLVQRIENRVDAVSTTLKGVSGGKLRSALGLKKGDGKQAHHLIPVQLLKENDVVQDAVAAGFSFNGKKNGLAVAGNHGPHSAYTESIRNRIDAWKESNSDYTPEQAKKFMEKLANEARQRIQKNGGDVKNTQL